MRSSQRWTVANRSQSWQCAIEDDLDELIELLSFATDFEFPLVITPAFSGDTRQPEYALSWLRDRIEQLEKIAVLAGAILLRDCAMHDVNCFQAFASMFKAHSAGYCAGAAPRLEVATGVFESTRMPYYLRIGLHHEKSYLPEYPRLIAFYCERQPESGGETILGDFARVCREMPDAMRRKFLDRGVLYRRNFRNPNEMFSEGDLRLFEHYHRPWNQALQTDSAVEAERLCLQRSLEFDWLSDGSITISNKRDAILAHPISRVPVWFNQIANLHCNENSMGRLLPILKRTYASRVAVPYQVLYGDGEPIASEELLPLYELIDGLTVTFPWRQGDILLVDNLRIAHGRAAYRGSRVVRVAMFD